MSRPFVFFLRVLAVLALAAPGLTAAAEAASEPAARAGSAGPAPARMLQDHLWTLQAATDASGKPIAALNLPGRTYVMSFDGARLGVEGGCNRMNGAWRIGPDGKFVAGRLAATMMACETALMRADEALSALLAQPQTISISPGATPVLRLASTTNETLVFGGKPTLRSLYGAPTRIFLEVAAQRVDCDPPGPTGACLRVRERIFDKNGLPANPAGAWTVFAGQIEGYSHTPGVRNVLRVDRYTRRPPATEGPEHVFVLDLVVESEKMAAR
jgi:heat shock protein HslJ